MIYEEWAILRHLVFIRCPICGKIVTTDNPTTFLGCENCLVETNYNKQQIDNYEKSWEKLFDFN